MSDLVLLVEPGSSGAAHAIARVRAVLAGEGSVALIAQGGHEQAVDAVGAELPIGPSVILTTSGSTGAPRAVELPSDVLRASAALAESRLGGPGLWLTAIPVTGAGGLNTIVRSLVHDVEPVVWAGVAGAAHFDGGSVLPALQDTRRRARSLGLRSYTSLVPTQIARLASHASAGDLDAVEALKELAKFDSVLVGADALGDELRNTMRAYDIHFVATYGATETCGGCVYNDEPLQGVELSFIGEDPGQIVVSGPTIARRYRDGDSSTLGDGRWISNDLGRMRMGRLEIVGRTDDLIKVGGHSIALPMIASHLRTLAELRDVVVLARPDAEWGQVPVTFVVGCAVSDATLRQFAAAAVGRSSIPMDIVRLDAMPLLPNGKVDRQRLLEL